MSDSGHSNSDTGTVLALFRRQQDERVLLSRVVTPPRKATRNRPSSVRRSFITPRVLTTPSQAEMNEAMYIDRCDVGHGTRQVVVRGSAKGQRLTDYHKQ